MTKQEKQALKNLAIIANKLTKKFDWDSIFQRDKDGAFVQDAIAFQSWLMHLNDCIIESVKKQCITCEDI